MMPRWQRSQKGRVCNMRYHNITKDDMLNGDGLRVVLWVAGCAHGCKECQNPVTWDPDGGLLFEEEAKKELFEQLEKSYISGITYRRDLRKYQTAEKSNRRICRIRFLCTGASDPGAGRDNQDSDRDPGGDGTGMGLKVLSEKRTWL